MKNTHGRVLLLVKLKFATLLKVTLLHLFFSRLLNCTNGTKPRKTSHILTLDVLREASDIRFPCYIQQFCMSLSTIRSLFGWKTLNRPRICISFIDFQIGQMKDEISQLQSKYNSEVANKEVLLFEESFILMQCLVFLAIQLEDE